MNKLILTFEILNGISHEVAFSQGVEMARVAMQGMNTQIINPMVGIEIKNERRTHAVEVRHLP